VPPAHPFSPRFWAFHLLALVLVGAAGWLGLWQYDAWQLRRTAEAEDVTRLEPAGALRDLMGPDDPFPAGKVGHPVVLSGRWVPDGSLYVSGREEDGVDGYWAVTPLRVGPGDAAIMVVRGWTATLDDVPAAPRGDAELVGWLQPAEGTGEVDDDPDDDVLPQLRIADALQHVGSDLYGAYAVVADEAAPGDWPVGDAATNPGTDGLERASLDQLPEAPRFTALRNLLYAIEWWIFGAFAAFIWWRWLRDLQEGEADLGEPQPAP
jgi:surfeit locus 1 family protein